MYEKMRLHGTKDEAERERARLTDSRYKNIMARKIEEELHNVREKK